MFFFEYAVSGNFSIKNKSFHLFVVLVWSILEGWDLYLTPRQPIGGGRQGGSHRKSSLLPNGRLGVIYDSQPHGYVLLL
jgi:hypothetical protein